MSKDTTQDDQSIKDTTTKPIIKPSKLFKKKAYKSKLKLFKIKPWIKSYITNYLNNIDDEILYNYIIELINTSTSESENDDLIDIKNIQNQLIGFLNEKESLEFCYKLYKIILDLQDGKTPEELIIEERKKSKIEIKSKPNGTNSSSTKGVKRTNYNRRSNFDLIEENDKKRKRQVDSYIPNKSGSKLDDDVKF
ncbi:uncharacterized protein KGF55_002151 [Candida pseudojiufengensis]|uniref:uncharacterized protein n=1 Tax=Candida pseudojiufengensis TaxID=497109 RepID=UPI0022243FDD|nr:uncharacterized protein KGF55_002151 [Candida pseudojiufengensis]KAI5964209.1 hypothetical protein KGF55_002151 [Candida pseudojiufengensis]